MSEEQLKDRIDSSIINNTEKYTKTIMLFDDISPWRLARQVEEYNESINIIPYSKVDNAIEDLKYGLKPDLVITDLGVEDNSVRSLFRNGINGEELALEARKNNIPVITMSDMNYKPYFSMFHVQKPAEAKELINGIENILKYK